MEDRVVFEHKTKEELKQIAQGLDLKKFSALNKGDLITLIMDRMQELEREKIEKERKKIEETEAQLSSELEESENVKNTHAAAPQRQNYDPRQKKRERPADVIEVCGVLDLMQEG
ncbi:MAG: Rho termination factor N-terminal domain-containing protein [Firmicutes bacterium]|nr:Rho termination factor N-terminal domain-containing protein [Bacillota bacterium]